MIPVFDNNPTKYKILVDHTPVFESTGDFVSGQAQYHDLDVELDAGRHCLDIRIDPTDRQFENIEIIELSFNNQKIRNDDLSLMSEYLLDHPRLIDGQLCNKLDQCNTIGWAGVYRFAFSTPMIPWILRNIDVLSTK